MYKLFVVLSFIGSFIIITACGAVGNVVYDNIGAHAELESFDVEEDYEVDHFEMPSWTSERDGKAIVNVDSIGAVGDGTFDDTQVNI